MALCRQKLGGIKNSSFLPIPSLPGNIVLTPEIGQSLAALGVINGCGNATPPQRPNFNSAHPLAFGCDGPTARLFLHFASRPAAPDTSIPRSWLKRAIESAIIGGMR